MVTAGPSVGPSLMKPVNQFRITLLDVAPPVWRRILVPVNYTFWDLHVAIQDAMGWNDSHLHHFEVLRKGAHHPMRFGVPFSDDIHDQPHLRPLPGWKHVVADFITLERPTCEYVYDFGDDWRHRVELEGIMRAELGTRYPVCIAGERACPPDDCGGAPGYGNLLEIIADPSHSEHEQMYQWLRSMKAITGRFEPEHFDPESIRFDNPSRRLSIASGGQLR